MIRYNGFSINAYVFQGYVLRNRRIGFAHERELAVKLWRKGFAVIRAPASGSKTKRIVYPDIVAIKNGYVLAIEVKTTHGEKPIYVPAHQVEKIKEFIKRSGGEGFIAVKIIGSGEWRFLRINDLIPTRKGNYKIDKETLTKSYRLSDLVSIVSGNKRLDEFLNT